MLMATPAAASPLPLKGVEPGRESSGGPFLPGEEPGLCARRGLQGTPADRQNRIRGVCLIGPNERLMKGMDWGATQSVTLKSKRN